jgi:hypothetical protein
MQSGEDDDLLAKIGAWLLAEGYPLEFATASAFSEAGFDVLQAEYTAPTPQRPRREVDVVAHMSRRDNQLLRVEFVVECKWSADKPWVFFCGGRGMTSAACATQSIGSQLAETLMWKEAANPALDELGLFRRTPRSAFGGRQAFSKSADVIFDAIRAVTGNCRALADSYDRGLDRALEHGSLPESAVTTFPVIVVEGRLFEASAGEKRLNLEEVPRTRLHFRGVRDQPFFIATVDVVRADELESFARERAADTKALLEVMSAGLRELRERTADGRLDRLNVKPGSRGVLGVPPLLASLMRARAAAETREPDGEQISAATDRREAPVGDTDVPEDD